MLVHKTAFKVAHTIVKNIARQYPTTKYDEKGANIKRVTWCGFGFLDERWPEERKSDLGESPAGEYDDLEDPCGFREVRYIDNEIPK